MPSVWIRAPLQSAPPRPIVVRRARAAAFVVAALLAIAAVVALEVKSVEYGLPVSELLEPETARLWVYETITSDGLLAPPPSIVKVRWAPALDDAGRAGLERTLALEPIELQAPRTWVYRLRNLSHANVRGLLADASVEDVDGLDRRGFAMPPEPLGPALDRLHRFGLVHVLSKGLDEPRRAQLIAIVRKAADPLMRWSFFAIVAACAACGVALWGRRRPLRGSHHSPRSVVRDPLSADCGLREAGEIGGTSALAGLQVKAPRVLQEALLSDPGGRAHGRAALYTAAIAAALLAFQGGLIWTPPIATNSPFAVRAFDAAFGRALCGAASAVHEFSPGLAILRDPGLYDVPIRRLIVDRVGSVDAYCASLAPFRIQENSPVLVMSSVLLWSPGASARTLAHGVNGAKLLMVLAMCFMCVSLGVGVIATYALAVVAIGVVAAVGHTYVQYSYLGLLLALGAVAWAYVERKGARRAAPVGGILLGLVTAFGINMRTSHAPVYAAFAALLVVLVFAGARRSQTRIVPGSIGGLAAGVVLGYLCFAGTFIWPIERATAQARSDYTSHPVAHALVLSLALSSRESLASPESVAGNELSRCEGILFDDERGLRLARRADPHVQYLGPGYEAAMWKYYLDLWRAYPGEMVDIYRRKFQLVNDEIRSWLRADDQPPIVRGVRRVVDASRWPRSLPLFWLYLAIFAGTVVGYLRSGGPAPAVLAFASLAACLVYLEATLVVPQFNAGYYNFVPIYLGMAAILLGQVAVDALARVSRWRRA